MLYLYYEIGVLKKLLTFTAKHLCISAMNFDKLLRILFLKNTSGQLLLNDQIFYGCKRFTVIAH